ncbi:MAG TPA: zinc ribbon domain-containing protein [Candidatus Binataceae bacterium]|jgi:putative FmdB family regulatory protein
MPIYEYRCTDCDRSFEALVCAGREDAECPGCHGSHLVREMSVFAARGGNGDGAAAAAQAIASNGGSGARSSGGCCGGGCGCH